MADKAHVNLLTETGKETYQQLIARLIKKGKLVEQGNGYQEPRTEKIYYALLNHPTPSQLYGDYKELQRLDSGKPLVKQRKKSGRFDVRDWFDTQEITDIALEIRKGHMGVLQSTQYPELKTAPQNIRSEQNIARAVREFHDTIAQYQATLAAAAQAGFSRKELEDGVPCLQHAETDASVALTGRAVEIIKKIVRVTNSTLSQSSLPKPTKAPALLPGSDSDTKQKSPAETRPAQHPERQQHWSEDDIAAFSASTSKRRDEVRPYALHDKPYAGNVPSLGSGSKVVMLDTGVLLRCFGMAGENMSVKGQKQEQEALIAFGATVFDSLVNNPRIDAVIIPDYVADVELCDRVVDYGSGKAVPKFLRDSARPNGKEFMPHLEEMLKHALRRHVDDHGDVNYMRDGSVNRESVNPKIIIWESKQGQQAIEQFIKDKSQYSFDRFLERESQRPGIDGGEKVIEALMSDPDFPAEKKMMLTTDYAHLLKNENKKHPNICRMNLGTYLQAQIHSDIPKWAGLSGYTAATEGEKYGHGMVLNIRHKMRESFNKIVKMVPEDNLAFSYCENGQLFEEMTGLTASPDARVQSGSKVIRTMREQSAHR